RDDRITEPGELGDAEDRLQDRGRRPTAAEAVDVLAGNAAFPDDVDACLGGQGCLAAVEVLRHEAGGGRARDGDAVLHVHDARPCSAKTGMGTPARSDQSSRTGAPMRMSSLAAPTTVEVKRRPSCSASSTVTTG